MFILTQMTLVIRVRHTGPQSPHPSPVSARRDTSGSACQARNGWARFGSTSGPQSRRSAP